MKKNIVYGDDLLNNALVNYSNPVVSISGRWNKSDSLLNLNNDVLSKHLLLVGGTGCGKTNVFFHLVSQLKRSMTSDDVMIIFDTKGDFVEKFYDSNKDVIIAKKNFKKDLLFWNIFKEALVDGNSDENINSNIQEISWSLFDDAIKKNSSNPFFPNAARDLFAALLTCIIRVGNDNLDFKKEFFNNKSLKGLFDELTVENIINMISAEKDLLSVLSYIGDGNNSQGLGVIAEMQTVVRKIFTEHFAQDGRFSIREFVRNKSAKTVFIEYDLSSGNVLIPVYQLLFDLALKEALGRTRSQGNVYLICDEFKLLPNLQHIDDAVNFGRGLGVKVVVGLQSISQIYDNYGEHRGKNIISGFSTVFSFRANDEITKKFVSERYGKNYVVEQYKSLNNSIIEKERIGNIVEDWDINSLCIGEAIIGFPFEKPFRFMFDIYNKNRR